jgi:hypothetical protein
VFAGGIKRMVVYWFRNDIEKSAFSKELDFLSHITSGHTLAFAISRLNDYDSSSQVLINSPLAPKKPTGKGIEDYYVHRHANPYDNDPIN